MSVKVSPKYQVVIPEEVRKALGIKPGAQIDVMIKGKVAYLVPVPDLESIQKDFAGKVDSRNLRDKKDRAL